MMQLYSYNGNEPYIFISYAHKDKNSVYPIIDRMQKDGYRAWFDEGIDPGTEWDETIAESIDKCGYFIAFVSNNYINSANCKDELKYARDLSKKCVLVYLEDVTLTKGMAMRMNRIQSIFKHRYSDEEDFYHKFYTSDGMSAFIAKNNAKNDEKEEKEKKSEALENEWKTINFSNGNTYTGEVNEAERMHGNGVLKFTSGNVYRGEFKNGTLCGIGTYNFENGTVYEGEMADGKFNGKGVFRYANGDIYEGDFKNGIRCGIGTYRFVSGAVYEGEMADDKFNGKGIYRFANGAVYEGEMTNNKLNGKGVYRYANGDAYEGEFENGIRCGIGTYRFANGAVYEGEMADDKFSGKGVFRYANGKVLDGEFKDGKFIQ